jgi:hypothetical protein
MSTFIERTDDFQPTRLYIDRLGRVLDVSCCYMDRVLTNNKKKMKNDEEEKKNIQNERKKARTNENEKVKK